MSSKIIQAYDIPKAVKMFHNPQEWLNCEPEHKELCLILEDLTFNPFFLSETKAIILLTQAGYTIEE